MILDLISGFAESQLPSVRLFGLGILFWRRFRRSQRSEFLLLAKNLSAVGRGFPRQSWRPSPDPCNRSRFLHKPEISKTISCFLVFVVSFFWNSSVRSRIDPETTPNPSGTRDSVMILILWSTYLGNL